MLLTLHLTLTKRHRHLVGKSLLYGTVKLQTNQLRQHSSNNSPPWWSSSHPTLNFYPHPQSTPHPPTSRLLARGISLRLKPGRNTTRAVSFSFTASTSSSCCTRRPFISRRLYLTCTRSAKPSAASSSKTMR